MTCCEPSMGVVTHSVAQDTFSLHDWSGHPPTVVRNSVAVSTLPGPPLARCLVAVKPHESMPRVVTSVRIVSVRIRLVHLPSLCRVSRSSAGSGLTKHGGQNARTALPSFRESCTLNQFAPCPQ